jgi:hypothetical protein
MLQIQEAGPDQNGPSFHNSRALLQRIDALPRGPEWICSMFHITGDKLDKNGDRRTEDIELWYRDPVECIYAPLRIYKNEQRTNRIYNEMWTCDWWWNTQVWMITTVCSNVQHLT